MHDLIAQTRQTYDGPLVVREDLMSFAIRETVPCPLTELVMPTHPPTHSNNGSADVGFLCNADIAIFCRALVAMPPPERRQMQQMVQQTPKSLNN